MDMNSNYVSLISTEIILDKGFYNLPDNLIQGPHRFKQALVVVKFNVMYTFI